MLTYFAIAAAIWLAIVTPLIAILAARRRRCGAGFQPAHSQTTIRSPQSPLPDYVYTLPARGPRPPIIQQFYFCEGLDTAPRFPQPSDN